MRKIIISGIGLLFSGILSCQIFHFYQPVVNNVLTSGGWHLLYEFNQGYNIKVPEFSVAVSPDNMVYFAYTENYYMNALKVFNEVSDGSFSQYGFDYYSNYSFPLIKFVKENDPFYPYPLILAKYSGMDLRILQCNTSAGSWNYTAFQSDASGMTSICDYYLQNTQLESTIIAYVNSMNSNLNVKICTDWAGNSWSTLIATNIGSIAFKSVSLAQSVNGHIYACMASDNKIIIYIYNTKNNDIKVNEFFDGKDAAKIFIDKNDRLHCVYTGQWSDHVVLKYKEFAIDNDTADLTLIKETAVYNDSVYHLDAFEQSAISLDYSNDRTMFYIGFIDLKFRQPKVFCYYNGLFTPIPGFPADLYNCTYIKIAVDNDNKAVVAVSQDYPSTNTFIFRMN
ncbi:MAG: hypothetical protein A2014_01085 [Spirochaetes bacterium GWF1_49_6]|nr:MAG: hypothetical protein A2014_01085 [Spirochaetes bacterium GWF1_49_6]